VKREIRLLIADDAYVIFRGIRTQVDEVCEGVVVVGEATNYDELECALQHSKPDVVLVDLNMAGAAAVSAGALRTQLSQARVIAMSA
jgi:YesN/AraC family two-component response regulator